MKINLTTQTEILTFNNDDDLKVDGYLYKYFVEELKEQLEKNPDINIKTLAYNNGSDKLVLLIINKEGFTQREIGLGEIITVEIPLEIDD